MCLNLIKIEPLILDIDFKKNILIKNAGNK